MFGSVILEVAIGVAFVYFIMSLMCTAINEIIESILKQRAKGLFRGIQELLHQSSDPKLLEDLYNHPLLYGLYKGNYKGKSHNLPSYIPSRNFALALLDTVIPTTSGNIDTPPPSLLHSVNSIQNEQIKKLLNSFLITSGENKDLLVQQVEAWYDSSMDRVSGWYKRYSQRISLFVAILITLFANANSITISKQLFIDKPLRDAVVAQAGAERKDDDLKNYKDFEKELNATGLPIGWENFNFHGIKGLSDNLWNRLFLHIVGWLITAIAVSLGAPFWFDILNRIMVIRSTVKPNEKSPNEPSVDPNNQRTFNLNISGAKPDGN